MKGLKIDDLMYINDGIMPFKVDYLSANGLGYKPYLPNIIGGSIYEEYDNYITNFNNLNMDELVDLSTLATQLNMENKIDDIGLENIEDMIRDRQAKLQGLDGSYSFTIRKDDNNDIYHYNNDNNDNEIYNDMYNHDFVDDLDNIDHLIKVIERKEYKTPEEKEMLKRLFIKKNRLLKLLGRNKMKGKGRMIGGMSNWDINNKLITQHNNKKNGMINNINMDDYIDEIEADNNLNQDAKNSKIKTEIYDMYNLLKLEMEKNKNFNNINDPNKEISDKKIETLKENLVNYISTLENSPIEENQIDDTIPKLIEVDKISTIKNEEYDKSEQKAKEKSNNLTINDKYKLLNPNDREKADKFKDENDRLNYINQLYVKYERGNINEDILIDNPIPIQNFTGDFSTILNSKDKKAYNKDIQDIFKKLTDEEFGNLFQYYPIDGIQNKTISEIKSFTRKNSRNPEDVQKYNSTKLYGYNNPYSEIKLSNDKTFKGSISYDFKYKNPSQSTNNEIRIENIMTSIKGYIIDNNTGEKKMIEIDNKPSLKENTQGYKYIWVEFNKDNILMKNALDEKYFDIKDKDGEKKILTDDKKEKYLEDFSKLYGEKLTIQQIKLKSSSKLINDILKKRKSPDFKLSEKDKESLLEYYLDLNEKKIIDDKKFDNIQEILENDKSIRENINKIFKDTLGNDEYLLNNELKKINQLMEIRNKIINKNPKIKKKYIEKDNNGKKKIIGYEGDTSFYPNIQVNNIVKEYINKNKEYNNKNHIKRKY